MVQVVSGLVLFEERLPVRLMVNSKGARTPHLSLSSTLCLEVDITSILLKDLPSGPGRMAQQLRGLSFHIDQFFELLTSTGSQELSEIQCNSILPDLRKGLHLTVTGLFQKVQFRPGHGRNRQGQYGGRVRSFWTPSTSSTPTSHTIFLWAHLPMSSPSPLSGALMKASLLKLD